MKETKNFSLELKQGEGEEGQVEARIATLGVVDLHGDLTAKGAFRKQSVLMSPWNHSSGRGQEPPVGKGVIDKNGVFTGSFFMKTVAGREAYEVAKAIASDSFKAEWSYGFNVEDSKEEVRDGETIRVLKKLDVFEVSPVIRGAGIDTETLSVKSTDTCPHCGRKGEIPNTTENGNGSPQGGAAGGTPSDEEIQAGNDLYLQFLETCGQLHDEI